MRTIEEIQLEIDQLNAQIADLMEVYKAMPTGCGCNAAGRAKNDARSKYKREAIGPLKDRIYTLKKEKYDA